MLKKAISLFVGAACLVSMTSAFAATYTGTTTTYKTDGTIQVDSTVTGTTGEVATYLVYDETLSSASAITTGDNIVYVDQYKFGTTADNGTKTFTYQTSSANVGAHIALGGAVELNNGSVEQGDVEGIKVTVNEGSTTGTYYIDPLPESSAAEWIKLGAYVPSDAVASVTVGSTTLTTEQWFAGEGLWILDSQIPADTTSKDGFTVTVTLSESTAAPVASTLAISYIAGGTTDYNDVDANGTDIDALASVVAVGQVTGDVDEFGIILATSEADAEQEISALTEDGSSSNAVKLAALGRNSDGKFAIRVYDEDGFSGSLYAVTYYKVGDNYTAAGEGKWINIPAAE